MKAKRTDRVPEVIGWREWIGLPELGIASMRAKIDTGARTSALHATHQERFERDGEPWVRFRVPVPGFGRASRVEAPIADEREVKNTSGLPERRIIIMVLLLLGRHRWHVETSLADREKMSFDMILGRTAIRAKRILVDPRHSFLAGRPRQRPATMSTRISLRQVKPRLSPRQPKPGTSPL